MDRLAIAAALGAALLASTAPPAHAYAPAHRMPAPPALDSGCVKVMYVGARGSGQSASGYGGMGHEVSALSAPIKARAATKRERFGTYGVPYTAASVSVLVPPQEIWIGGVAAANAYVWDTGLPRYLASINDGVNRTIAYVKSYSAACPNARFVLAGYSQGAIVMHQAERVLSAGLRSKIAATLLLADGDRVKSSAAKHFGTAPVGQEGVENWATKGLRAHDVALPAATAEICNKGDIVCDTSDGVFPYHPAAGVKVHTSYLTANSAAMNAARWAAGRI